MKKNLKKKEKESHLKGWRKGLSRLLRYKYYQPLADWRFILQNPKGLALTDHVKEHQDMNGESQPNFACFLFFLYHQGNHEG